MGMYTRVSPLGINLDIDSVELNGQAYQQLLNMVAKPAKMVRARGYTEIWDAAEVPQGDPRTQAAIFPPYYLQYAPQLGAQYWIFCGTDGIGVVDPSGVQAEISPLAGISPVAPNAWTGGNLNGIAIFNAVENPAYHWYNGIPPTGEAEIMPGLRLDTRYRVMRPFKYHVIGMNVTDLTGTYEDAIHWSDAADPGRVPLTWVPDVDNEAGDNILADENGAIIDGMALRDAFFIYKQDAVYEMTYIGGNEVFRFVKVFGTTGVLSANCIARVKGTHVVLGNGDIYRHDGQNMESLIDGKLRENFFAAIDPQNFATSYVAYLEPEEEVWFCVPVTGENRPSLALVWNVVTGEFGYRNIPAANFIASGVVGSASEELAAWDTETGAWVDDTRQWTQTTLASTEDSLVLADADNSAFYLANSGTTQNGTPYDSGLTLYGLDLGDPQRDKAVRRIWPRINAPLDTTFTLTLYTQPSAHYLPEVSETITFQTNGEGVAVNGNGRYVGMGLYTADQVDWDIAGYDVEYLPRGRF